jgi:hypothetical protein
MGRLFKISTPVWVVACFVSHAAPAHAQLQFTNENGRAVELSGPGLPSRPMFISMKRRSAANIAQFFREACLDTRLDPQAVDGKASAPLWALRRTDVKIPFNGPLFDRPVPVWVGDGASLVATQTTVGFATGSGFRVAGPQCTLVTGDYAISAADMEAAISKALGAGPANIGDSFKKNGKPNSRYEPRWKWTGSDGTVQDIGFTIMQPGGVSAGKLQIALIPPKAEKALMTGATRMIHAVQAR